MFIGHSRMLRVEIRQARHFSVGALHEVELADKPSVAVGGRVFDGDVFRDDEIFRVEHVEHRHEAVEVECFHVARLRQSLIKCCMLLIEMALNEVLVALQFGGMVASDVLVPIARGVFAEGVAHGVVEHAVVGVGVSENLLVGRRFLRHIFAAHDGVGEVVVVEVVAVDRPHVHQGHQGQRSAGGPGRNLLDARAEQEDAAANDEHDERAEGRGRQHGATHDVDSVGVAAEEISVESPRLGKEVHRGHFIGREQWAEGGRGEPEEQAEARSHCRCNAQTDFSA